MGVPYKPISAQGFWLVETFNEPGTLRQQKLRHKNSIKTLFLQVHAVNLYIQDLLINSCLHKFDILCRMTSRCSKRTCFKSLSESLMSFTQIHVRMAGYSKPQAYFMYKKLVPNQDINQPPQGCYKLIQFNSYSAFDLVCACMMFDTNILMTLTVILTESI